MSDALAIYGPLAAHFAAFWVALALYLGRAEDDRDAVRFLVGLAAAGAFAHLGWVALHARVALAQPELALDVTRGFTVLFMPLGLLLAAPWGGPSARREAFLADALGALPLALAVARGGCLLGGCCGGEADAAHPVPLYEIAALLALHAAARSVPAALVSGLVLAGFGAIRLALDPLRPLPPIGPPAVPAALLAAGWLAAGAVLGARALAGGTRGAAPQRSRL
jgi:hypothetical protein